MGYVLSKLKQNALGSKKNFPPEISIDFAIFTFYVRIFGYQVIHQNMGPMEFSYIGLFRM